MKWAAVPRFESYEVSEIGTVRRADTHQPIATWVKEDGYYRFTVRRRDDDGAVKRNLSLHRVVALLFVPNPDAKPEVNHKDGFISNNAATNLVWSTKSENNFHRTRVLKSFQNKVQRALVAPDGRILCVDNLTMFAEQIGVHPASASKLARREIASLRGWRLATEEEALDAVA